MSEDLFACAYDLSCNAWDLLQSDTEFSLFATQVRHKLEDMLRSPQKRKQAVLKEIYALLSMLDVLQGRYEDAPRHIALARSHAERASAKLTASIITEAIVRARSTAVSANFHEQVRACFASAISNLPWNVVSGELKQMRAYLELKHPSIYEGLVRTTIDPIIAAHGSINHELAQTLIHIRYNLIEILPICEELKSALDEVINSSEKCCADIWQSRAVVFSGKETLSPVIIGIWDSGIDTGVLEGKMGSAGGKCGIAWDIQARSSPDLLYPLNKLELDTYTEMVGYLRGFLELSAGIISLHSEALKRRTSMLAPNEVTSFWERLDLVTNYIHGTHVAGIAIEGNPFCRLLSARITWNHALSAPPLLSRELVESQIATYERTLEFFQLGCARVINISWNRSPALYMGTNGSSEVSSQLLEMDRTAFYAALKGAADILFVIASGNTSEDVSIGQYFPACFRLPNLIVVGAADKGGEETTFSNFGDAVTVYADGCDVESCIPGGHRLVLSGTSMAAAQVTNLAGKLLAIEPNLSPPELVALIIANADWSADGRRRLLNPRRSVDALRGIAKISLRHA